MDWSNIRHEQNQAYEESLLQDILKKTAIPEPDKKLTVAELREKFRKQFEAQAAASGANQGDTSIQSNVEITVIPDVVAEHTAAATENSDTATANVIVNVIGDSGNGTGFHTPTGEGIETDTK